MREVDFAQGFAAQLTPGNTPAVLSIDLMVAYFRDGSPLCLSDTKFLNVASEVINSARASDVPVIHTSVQYGPGGKDGGVFLRKVPALESFVGGTSDSEIMQEVAPTNAETVIIKNYASAFFGTSLASTLVSQGVDTVYILGTSTSGCVRATAVDAIQHGFIPIVVSDAVGDREKSVHEASLYDLQAKYAEVITSREAIQLLTRT